MADGAPALPQPEISVAGARPDCGPRRPSSSSLRIRGPLRAGDLHRRAHDPRPRRSESGRGYNPETREALADLFGPAERMAGSVQSLVWGQASVPDAQLLAGGDARRSDAVHVRPRGLDGEVLRVASGRRRAARLPLQRHDPLRRRGRPAPDRPRAWACTARYRMRVDVWRRAVAARFARTGWPEAHEETLERLRRRQAALGLPSFDDATGWTRARVASRSSSLLLARATRSIRTPPARRRTRPRRRSGSSTRPRTPQGQRHLRPPPGAVPRPGGRRARARGEVFFLQSAEGHAAVERRVGIGPFAAGPLRGDVTLALELEAAGVRRRRSGSRTRRRRRP